MPIVHIHLQDCWDRATMKNMSDAVHEALVEAFKIPEHDYNHRMIVTPKELFFHSEHWSEKYVLVEINAYPGRSREAKKRLYDGIMDRFKAFGLKAGDYTVIIHEPPLTNWTNKGAIADENDIGFKLDV